MELERHELDEEAPPSIVINPHSELGKELRRWEQHRTHLVPQGTNPGNPYVFREFPKMLYRAQRKPIGGQVACLLPAPHPHEFEKADAYDRACQMKETFDRACQRIVKSADEEAIAKGQGWCVTPQAALDQFEAEQRALGQAAAEAAAAAARMTATAQAEFTAAEAQTHEHVTDVVPMRKRGRPAKGVVAKVGSTAVDEG